MHFNTVFGMQTSAPHNGTTAELPLRGIHVISPSDKTTTTSLLTDTANTTNIVYKGIGKGKDRDLRDVLNMQYNRLVHA